MSKIGSTQWEYGRIVDETWMATGVVAEHPSDADHPAPEERPTDDEPLTPDESDEYEDIIPDEPQGGEA